MFRIFKDMLLLTCFLSCVSSASSLSSSSSTTPPPDAPSGKPAVNIDFKIEIITPEFIEELLGKADWIDQWKYSQKEHLIIIGAEATHTYNNQQQKQFADEVVSYCSNFVFNVKQGFRKIARTNVGKQLLKEILSVDLKQPILILQNDIYLLLAISSYIDNKPESLGMKQYIDYIRKSTWNGLLPIKSEYIRKVMDQARIYLEVKSQSCNLEAHLAQNVVTGPHVEVSCHPGSVFTHNMVFLGGHDRLLISTVTVGSTSQAEFKLEFKAPNLENDFDMFMFHELNHYRHFLQQRRTFKPDGVHMYEGSIKGVKSSFNSKLIRRRKGSRSVPQVESVNMFSNEEELQLTGFTILPDTTAEIDPVNETCYRIQRSLPESVVLRYPYNTPYLVLEQSSMAEQFDWFVDSSTLNTALSGVFKGTIRVVIDFYKGLKPA